MKNIILIPSAPFKKRDYDRYGIKTLKKYFNVFIMDLSPWVSPITWKSSLDDVYKTEGYIAINNKDDLLSFILNLKSPIVIDRIQKNKKTNWVRALLENQQSVFVDLKLGDFPYRNHNFLTKSKNLFKYINKPKIFLERIVNYLEEKYYGKKIYTPNVTIFGGLNSLNKSKIKNKILSHSLDYETYLNLEEKKINNENVYAVFLDVNLPMHPDYKLLKRNSPIDFSKYYKQLGIFLKKFEMATKIPVHFSAHPRTSDKVLDSIKTLLAGTRCSIGKSAELVRDSRAVLTHCSTSISYAVSFKKPIFFLTSHELKKSWYHESCIKPLEIFFKSRAMNIDMKIDEELVIQFLSRVNEEVYKKYKDSYLKIPNSSDEPIWENFSKYILKNNFN